MRWPNLALVCVADPSDTVPPVRIAWLKKFEGDDMFQHTLVNQSQLEFDWDTAQVGVWLTVEGGMGVTLQYMFTVDAAWVGYLTGRRLVCRLVVQGRCPGSDRQPMEACFLTLESISGCTLPGDPCCAASMEAWVPLCMQQDPAMGR